MSYKEAIDDRIRMDKHRGQTKYYPPCRFCGEEVLSYNYLRTMMYVCLSCRPKKKILLGTGLFGGRL